MAIDAGGTNQRLKLGLAMMASLSKNLGIDMVGKRKPLYLFTLREISE